MVHTIFWLFGFIFLFHIPVCRRNGSITKDNLDLSIIIPALNEEKNLPILLESIRKQSIIPHEIIVVVSPSEDRTLEIARQSGASVVLTDKIPAGWFGKSWSCYQGVKASSGNVLMFLDADTRLEEEGLSRIIDSYLSSEGALSVQPYHRTLKAYEQLSSMFNLVAMAAMGSFTIFGRKIQPTGMFGPCIVISRKEYEDVGGHAAVKGDVVEDMALGAVLKRFRIPVNCVGGRKSISFRMYPGGFGEMIDGWTKNFASGAARTPIWLLISIIIWIGGSLGAIISLGEGLYILDVKQTILSFVIYAAYVLQIYWMLARIGKFSIFAAIFYPVFMLFFFYVFLRSIVWIFILKKIRWKGRVIDIKDKVITR